MKKKILVTALILMFVTVAIAFADADVTFTSNSVSVRNTGRGTLSRVEVCVIYEDAAGIRRETSMLFTNVKSAWVRQNFNLGTVKGVYTTFCTVPTDD